MTLIAEAFIAMVSPNSASSPTATDGSVSLNIMGSGTPPFSIQWNTGDTAVMSLTGLAPGFYCATVTDANGCARTGCTDVTYPLSDTQPFGINSGLLLYPNPVVCGEWIHFDNKSVSGTWNLLNAVGQVCDYQVLEEGQTSVRIPETLPEGIYSVIVKNLHFSQVGKIFLQKRR